MVPVAVAQIIKSRRLFREKKRRCFEREPPKSRDVTGSITATLRAVLDFASTGEEVLSFTMNIFTGAAAVRRRHCRLVPLSAP